MYFMCYSISESAFPQVWPKAKQWLDFSLLKKRVCHILKVFGSDWIS